MANGSLNIVKKVVDRHDPTEFNWWKLEIDDSRKIPGLQKNYIWHLSNEGAEYDTHDGFVVSAPDYDMAWALACGRGRLSDPEYDTGIPWIVELVGIDLSSAGNRVIESSFRAG